MLDSGGLTCRRRAHDWPTRVWYARAHPLSLILLPLSWLYRAVVMLRRRAYQCGWREARRLAVPVVVVGNLTVGGTGKTPLVLALVELLRARGRHPAILTRGYRGRARDWPRRVAPDSDPRLCGDEAVLLARRGGCPVVAGPDRAAAGALALADGACDVLLCDDGLQHYRLARDLEIALIDGERGFGNGRCLPAGPLREPPARLAAVDLVLYHGGPLPRRGMELEPGTPVNLCDGGRTCPLAGFAGAPLLAVAGIGHPERFFDLLRAAGLEFEPRAYPDHHDFSAAEVAAWGARTVLMTEKDAVKCVRFARAEHWYLPVSARLEADFIERFFARLAEFQA